MNKIIYLLSILFFIVACKPSEPEIKDISFSGKIENSNGDTLKVRRDGKIEKFAIAEDGSFSGLIKGGEGYYKMRYNRENADVYFEKGAELVVTTDMENFDSTLVFTGIGNEVNNYLISKTLLNSKNKEEFNTKTLYSMEENDFLNQINKFEESMMANLKSVSLSPTFTSLESKDIKYKFINSKKMYEPYKRHFSGDEEFTVSADFNKQFESLDYTNDSDFKAVPEYNSMVMNYFTDGELKECLELLKPVASPSIKKEVVELLGKYYLSPSTENLSTIVEEMKSMVTDTELLASLDESHSKMMALTKGNTSPGFDYKSIKGTNVNLNDLKGKNVYIDVWATWCGPCKAEIPYLKELEKSFHGDNIEFVSISVDVPKDEKKWEKMIAEKELKGIQLLSDNGWDTDFVKDYLIKGIPRFILIDHEGKIVSADAPRPSSDDELKSMIKALL